MSVAVSRSEPALAVLHGVRAVGGVELAVREDAGRTRLASLTERGGFRAKFPQPDHGLEAVLINTGGGMLGGDAYRFRITAGPASDAVVTSQSAERVYRTLGPATQSDVMLSVASGARLGWLPQPTILFDGARLHRRIDADLATDASLLLVEAIVFGRTAHGERVRSGDVQDQWRIRRDGQLVFAEALTASGDLDTQLQRAAIGAGAQAAATLLYVAPDAEDRRDAVRAAISATKTRAAVSAWNGLLTARFLSPDASTLRADLVHAVGQLLRRPLPRVWTI